MAGHEYSAKEEYEKAKNNYNKAIRLDHHNVRAYWGMGNLHLKTEKYEVAKNFFEQAIKIN